DGCTQILAKTEEVALGERQLAKDAVGGGVAGACAILTGRLLDNVDVEDDLVRGRARGGRNLDAREEAEGFDVLAATDNGRTVERVAFSKAQLATDHEVAGLDVAGDVDALDIDASTFVDQVGHVERAGGHVAI